MFYFKRIYEKEFKIIIYGSFIICCLISLASLTGIMPEFYYRETSNWEMQSFGQDIMNLCVVVPFLLITVFIKKEYGLFLWSGGILYTLYTFLIYCFDIHFNVLFLDYCAILGLNFYLFLYFMYRQNSNPTYVYNTSRVSKITGFYFLIIAILFYCLWLSEIIPAIQSDSVPKSVADAGVFTNPVHVIDIAIMLPGVFMVGVFLLREKKIGSLFAPIILSFLLLMSITIIVLSFLLSQGEKNNNLPVIFIMSVFALLNILLLVLNFSKKGNV